MSVAKFDESTVLRLVSELRDSLLTNSILKNVTHRQQSVEKAMLLLCSSLNKARLELSPPTWAGLLKKLSDHPVKQLLLLDPFTKRVHDKPRGYAGDAKMLDYLYFNPEDANVQPIGADVQRFLCGSPAGRAVRERAMIMGELIDRMAQRLQSDRKLRVLSVACGHARELFLSESFLQHKVCFTGLDADVKSLQTMNHSFGGFDVTALPWPVKKILNRDHELLSRGQYDLVYSCGLFDYLNDQTGSKLTETMFNDLVRPGGKLIIANFMDHFIRGYMEAFMNWNLIYRDTFELSNMAKNLASDCKAVHLFKDTSSVLAFLEIDKILVNDNAVELFKQPSKLTAKL
jgi:extracellular factor (EF) 3-hydroxypalmitic acid methyl ester biosynthesis protein